MPRIIEFWIACFLLLLLSPLFLLVMAAILIDSPGYPFFSQRRVGIHGNYFWMLKFRKMHNSVPKDGKGITTQNDVRLTRIGRILERFKLDELPQLINVICGDMALVGPRPEIPKFTAHYPEKWKQVLTVKPGIVGYNQIVTPHENDLYPADCLDHEAYYVEHILPSKLDEEIHYLRHKNLWFDLSILMRVSFSLFSKTITKKWIFVRLSQLFMFLSDLAVSAVSILTGFYLVYQNGVPQDVYPQMYYVLGYVVLIRPLVFLLFGLHKNPISSTITFHYLLQIIKAVFYSTLVLILTLMFMDKRDLLLSAHIVDFFVLPFLMIGSRVAYIFVHDSLLKTGSLTSLSRAFLHAVVIFGFGLTGFFSFWAAHMIWLDELNINVLIPKIGFISLCALLIRMGLAVLVWPPQATTWRAFWGKDFIKNLNAAVIGTGFILVMYLVLQEQNYSRISLIFDFSVFLLVSTILMLVWSVPQILSRRSQQVKKIIILGVNVETDLLISTLQRIDSEHWKIIGIITNIEWKRYASISGINVIGTIADLASVIELHHPDILVTWDSIRQSTTFPYVEEVCQKNGVSIVVSPSLSQLLEHEGDDRSLMATVQNIEKAKTTNSTE